MRCGWSAPLEQACRVAVGNLFYNLACAHLIYAQRTPSFQVLRVSTAHFTSQDDIDTLLAALDGLAGDA